ncbi:hypothetical protein FHR90_002979 [Endobacter medicaginis]|uniref:Uncharacterized protein n=1 Tax=Endobacter medicaginis TaxID=1181271 RepID=A0A839V3L2_9PROT|nr:hypothetical protein [Endobacter medicaginis]MBB3175130.1 hypothetical protein [Endobacter medicaginis]MCX5476445.1 hypothetical protein [Endobacter medicaginis]NVN31263.1 hypothetical protein [Endobacter medicaginis]
MPDPSLPTERALLAGAQFLHNSLQSDMTSWVMRHRIAAEGSRVDQQILAAIAPLEGGAAIADMLQADRDIVSLGLDTATLYEPRVRISIYAALSGHSHSAKSCATACHFLDVRGPWLHAWSELRHWLNEADMEAGERSAQLHKFKRADDSYAQQNHRHLLKFAGVAQ